MAAVISIEDVQAWLERTKAFLDVLPADLEEAARSEVYGRLAFAYDISTWVDEPSTPLLVRKVIAMLTAAWFYNRQYAEEDPSGNPFAMWLEQKAYAIITGLTTGAIALTDVVDGRLASTTEPSFWPDDTTGTEIPTDGLGNEIGREGGSDRKFYTGAVW